MVHEDAAAGEKEVKDIKESEIEIIQKEVDGIEDLHQPSLNNESDISETAPISLPISAPDVSEETEETTHLPPPKDSMESLPSTTLVDSPPPPPPLQRSSRPETTGEMYRYINDELSRLLLELERVINDEWSRMLLESVILTGLILPGVGNKPPDKLAAIRNE